MHLDEYQYRRDLTQLMHVVIPTLVLTTVCLGYDGHVKAVFDHDLAFSDDYSPRDTCDFSTLTSWAGGWVAMDVIALICTLVVLIVLWVVEPSKAGATTSSRKKTFTSVTIGLLALAMVCEIAAEIMRILFFANKIGLDRDVDYCIYGDAINDIQDVGVREAVKDIVRLEWWFYPFTTFVCGFASFILHAFGIGMAGRMCAGRSTSSVSALR